VSALTTSFAVAALAVCLNPVIHVAHDRVDLIEVNHFYDERGRLVFDQIIFYDWCSARGGFNIRAWRLLKSPDQRPLAQRERGSYVSMWRDGDTLRKVEAPAVRESWTQYDPELVERSVLPRDRRVGLRRLNIRSQ
jgi:hypothetical protein